MIKLLEIDTNGENAYKFEQNETLFNIIIPNIIFLVTTEREVIYKERIDWGKTSQYFRVGSNGHCIYLTNGEYIAAYEFTHLVVEFDAITLEYVNTLSDLCDCMANVYDVTSWNPKY